MGKWTRNPFEGSSEEFKFAYFSVGCNQAKLCRHEPPVLHTGEYIPLLTEDGVGEFIDDEDQPDYFREINSLTKRSDWY